MGICYCMPSGIQVVASTDHSAEIVSALFIFLDVVQKLAGSLVKVLD